MYVQQIFKQIKTQNLYLCYLSKTLKKLIFCKYNHECIENNYINQIKIVIIKNYSLKTLFWLLLLIRYFGVVDPKRHAEFANKNNRILV